MILPREHMLRLKVVAKVAAALAGLTLLCLVYVAATAGRELTAARRILSGISVPNAERADVVAAKDHLWRAVHYLDSVPAVALRAVPVARQNLDALEALTKATIPVLNAGLALDEYLDEVEDARLIRDGRLDLEMIDRLGPPLQAQIEAVTALESVARTHRTGWLVPPLWDALDDLVFRLSPVMQRGRSVVDLVEASDALFGAHGRRRYAVLLINNAELRGAGGVLTGIGTISFSEGTVSLGEFSSVHDLRTDPPERVPAPADYERRFGTFRANSTLWLNATWSPDVPDVARVAANLLRRTRGIEVDGAILIDPRGVQALADPDEAVSFPGLEPSIPPSRLAEFIYSGVYERFSDQTARRAAILAAGTGVLRDLVDGEDLGRERLARIGEAASAGHLRLVSFDRAEAAALDVLDASGELRTPPGTLGVTLTEQNLGTGNGQGSKLDYWVQRRFGYACTFAVDRPVCTFRAQLTNQTPRRLDRYVAGNPYGLVRSYTEVYLPAEAEVTAVTVDGSETSFRRETEEGSAAIGLLLEVPRGRTRDLIVRHELPPATPRRIELRPQPLPRDAILEVALEASPDATVYVGDERARGSMRRSLVWDRVVTAGVSPYERRGLPRLWDRLVGFWTRPLF